MRTLRPVFMGVALLLTSCSAGPEPPADKAKVVLYEGLPHQLFEKDLLKQERATKKTRTIDGYSFYEQPVPLEEQDAARLVEILADPTTYEPFSGEKKCGGFHPDFAIDWAVGSGRQQALLCFGCDEIKLFKPGAAARHDMNREAKTELCKVLLNYCNRNRPVSRDEPIKRRLESYLHDPE